MFSSSLRAITNEKKKSKKKSVHVTNHGNKYPTLYVVELWLIFKKVLKLLVEKFLPEKSMACDMLSSIV